MTSIETNSVVKKSGHILLALLLAVGLTACDLTEGFDQDPNAPGDAPATKVLNSAEVGAILFQDGNHARLTSMFTEQLNGADRQYAGQDRPQYGLTATDVNNLWITGYADAIGDLQVVKEKARASNNSLLLGIAQAVEGLTYGTKTSLHGSIPFQNAAQGNANLNPDFDPQLEVYSGVLDTLSAAVSNIQAGGLSPGEDDVFYEGATGPWVEAVNTLMARYMLHVAHVNSEPVGGITFQDVYDATQNGISSTDNNLVAPHGQSIAVNANPFWQFRNDRGDDMDAAGSYAARLLDEDSDLYRGNAKTDETERFDFYFFGDEPGYDMAGNASTNDEAGFFYSRSADFPIATYVENELIKAEAALHSGQGFGVALDALNNARAANEQKFGGTYEDYVEADFQSGGILNPNGNMSQSEALLQEILEEKYVSLISNIEAYADLRRTENFAGIQDSDGDVLTMSGDDAVPQRFPVAQSEVTGNENAPDPIPGIFQLTPANEADYPTP
jgi:hypothetical protein